jgi:uncharacterized membrane protein YccF (DUF307 family)
MSILQAIPIVAYLGCVIAIVAVALGWKSTYPLRWIIPTVIGAAFLVFSMLTVAQEGLIQFWANHTTNLAGNQVWFDLLIAVTLCFFLLAPRAQAVGMRRVPWAIAVFSTASIALLPMFARVVWLENRMRP